MKGLKIIKLTFSILVAVQMSSCIEDVDDKYLPKTEAKLVVYSVLSPTDETIVVKLWRSLPVQYNSPVIVNYDNDQVVENATVTLIEMLSGNQVVLPFDNTFRNYQLPTNDFPIEPGKSYSLMVNAPGFKSISSSTSIVNSLNVDYEVIAKRVSTQNEQSILFTGKVYDISGESNYYSIQGIAYYTYSYDYGNTVITYNSVYTSQKLAISDKNRDGDQIPFRLKIYEYGDPSKKLDSLVLTIANIDKHYYQYFRTTSAYDNDNPFSEPEPIYTNVINGLGLFSSILEYRHIVELESN
jgi:hypothetical protein